MATKKYRFKTTCPKCGKQDEIPSDTLTPTVYCGDCMINHVEIIPVKISLITREKLNDAR